MILVPLIGVVTVIATLQGTHYYKKLSGSVGIR